MEQKLESHRQARMKGKALSDGRAMELQMQSPQTYDRNTFEETTPQGRGGALCGGGEAGLRRVVGTGKPRGRPRKAMNTMCGGAATLNDQMGTDADACGGGMVGGAKEMGKALAKQLKDLHGKEFADKFHKGLMDELSGSAMPDMMEMMDKKSKKVRGGAGPMSAPPMGRQVVHARMSSTQQGLPGQGLGGQDVPPGGLAPIAYGNTPQAPASFARNTIGMGRPAGAGMYGGAMPAGAGMVCSTKERGGAKALLGRPGHGTQQGGVVSGGGRSARGQAIAKLMREKGLTLGQASKHLKEHGSS